MYQKLTYNSENNNYLYLMFYADVFDVDIVTRALEIEPTSVTIKKDPRPKTTSWIYTIDAGDDIDLETYLERLIVLFENKIDAINQLKENLLLETRLQFVINVDINPDSSTPYFGLNKRTIDFLSRTGTEVDFDLYKVDVIGLLREADED